MLIAINYHYIREHFDAPYPSIFGVTPEDFSLQLDVLGRSACFLGIDDIVDIVDGKRSLPDRAVVITFDDGLKEQYEFAWPVLQKKGIPAIFYAITRPIEESFVTTTHKIHIIRAYTHPDGLLKHLQAVLAKESLEFSLPDAHKAQKVYRYDSVENARLKFFLNHVLEEKQQELVVGQIFHKAGFDQASMSNELYMDKCMTAELAESGCLGTHGHAHRPLGLLDNENALSDFVTSMNKLSEWTGLNVTTLSYPFGFREACSKTVAHQAERMGIKFAFTLERAGNMKIDAPMFMARFSVSDIFNAKRPGNIEEFWDKVTHASWFRYS
ncbi:polysaccharide deacetylase family protein [Desulfonatronospira sp.]|uniref:polysaccharide deacetylase family protein n=1 Tax=Desulfonatronospira sp. TaxID=1962951 RepID=UPI0025BC3E38|nr:polysaccharide deacetylase family protein [Desulfonatronospira sp.]